MWVEINSSRVVIDGVVRGVLAISRNIQKRKEVERKLRDSEEKYRSLVEALPHMVAIVQDSRIVFVNGALRERFGDPADFGHDPLSHVAPGLEARARTFMNKRLAGESAPSSYQSVIVDPQGREFPVEIHARPMTFRGKPAVQYVVMDLSERVTLEERLQHAQKLEAIGVLAGGVAHEFNNMLTAILATADIVRQRHEPGDPDYRAAELIYDAARQSAGLTQQLLGFARKSKPERKLVDLRSLVADVSELLESTLGPDIRVEKELDDAAVHALGDPGQLRQVFVNLVVNARGAMPSGGRLSIRTERVSLGDQAILDSFAIQAGEYVRLVVEDTGVGIPDAIRARVFEPFFTTKRDGEGSGMGLAVVYGILRAHGAAIAIESQEGRGTKVSVYLPPAESTRAERPSRPKPVSGRGVVLLVEDERFVRETATQILESLGYEVIPCVDGRDAVARFRRERGRVAVALIDVQMPHMDGWTCLKELRQIAPALRVVMTSGHGHGSSEPDVPHEFLAKPYDIESLGAAIARQLAQRSGSG
jgi:PAS domain S-box-containing protein